MQTLNQSVKSLAKSVSACVAVRIVALDFPAAKVADIKAAAKAAKLGISAHTVALQVGRARNLQA